MKITKTSELIGHKNSLYALSPALDAHKFYAAGADGNVVEWDLDAPDTAQLLVQVNQPVYALRLDAAKKMLFIAQKAGGLHIVDLDRKQEVKLLNLHQKEVFDVSIVHNHIICASADGKISVINNENYTFEKYLTDLDCSVRCVTNSVKCNVFAVGSSDGCIRIYDSSTHQLKKILQKHTNSVFTLAFSPCNNYLVSGSRDAHLIVWDINNNYEVMKQIPAHYFTINSLCFSPCTQYLATASRDKNIRIWNARTFELLKVIDAVRNGAHKASVNKLWWSSYKNQLVSCGDDKKIMTWQID